MKFGIIKFRKVRAIENRSTDKTSVKGRLHLAAISESLEPKCSANVFVLRGQLSEAVIFQASFSDHSRQILLYYKKS